MRPCQLSFALLAAMAAGPACAAAPKVERLDPPMHGGQPAADPAVALDPTTGDLLMTWVEETGEDWSLWFARSTDDGSHWQEAVRVTEPGEPLQPHAESAPRLVATASGVIAAVWTTSVVVEGRRWPASDIRFSRTTDGGASWSRAITLNDDTTAGPGGHTFHGAAWGGDSTVVVAWMDGRLAYATASSHHGDAHGAAVEEPDAQVFVATSDDLGVTWSARNEAAWDAACPCCRVSLARGPDGRVYAGWRKHLGANVRDVVASQLYPSTREPTVVHDDGWVYPGCPHAGPGLDAGADGRTHVGWYTGAENHAGVFYVASRPEAMTFDEPVGLSVGAFHPTTHVAVSAGPFGAALVAWDATPTERAIHLAWMDDRGRLVAQTRVPDSEGADHPQTLSLGDGSYVVAWAQQTESGSRIGMARAKK